MRLSSGLLDRRVRDPQHGFVDSLYMYYCSQLRLTATLCCPLKAVRGEQSKAEVARYAHRNSSVVEDVSRNDTALAVQGSI